MAIPAYTIPPFIKRPEMQGLWQGAAWRGVPCVELTYFRPESSHHRPLTRVKLLHGPEGLFGLFQVHDRYVRCVHTDLQSDVYKDSCVEFFVQPRSDRGYFNFEFNCGGALLASYITDPARTASGFKQFARLSLSECRRVRIHHSLPKWVAPEITAPTLWMIEFFLPFGLLANYVGSLAPQPGDRWRGNFYKCGDETSHPHWGAWSPVDQLNFHRPQCFGTLRIGPPAPGC